MNLQARLRKILSKSLRPIAHEGHTRGVWHAHLERLTARSQDHACAEPEGGEDGFAVVTVRLRTSLPVWLVRQYWRREHFSIDTAPWGHYATVYLFGVPAFAVASPVEQYAALDSRAHEEAGERLAGRAVGDVYVSEAYVEEAPWSGTVASLTLRQRITEMGKMDCGVDASVVWEQFTVFGLHVPEPREAKIEVVRTDLCDAHGEALYAVSIDSNAAPDRDGVSRTITALLRRPSNHGLDATKFARDETFTPYALLNFDGAMGEWEINLRDRWTTRRDGAAEQNPAPLKKAPAVEAAPALYPPDLNADPAAHPGDDSLARHVHDILATPTP